MRNVMIIIGLAVVLTAAVHFGNTSGLTLAAPPTQSDAGTPASSLLKQSVVVHFRGSDSISAPIPDQGNGHLALKLQTLTGTVESATPDWVELRGEFGHAWVPTHSIALITESADRPSPTTKPK